MAAEQGEQADEAFGGDRPDRSRRRVPRRAIADAGTASQPIANVCRAQAMRA